eukprot:jgi/Botrbrau1/9013/Bobra.0148s0115.1
MIIMEYCDGGTLWQALQEGWFVDEHTGLPKMSTILRLAEEIAIGLEYIHNQNVLHRDITSRNILLKRGADGQLHAKVSDFGLSVIVKPGQMNSTNMLRGALAYCGPEVLNDVDNSFASLFASDVYSFGVVLWELYTRQVPYAGLSELEIVTRKVYSPGAADRDLEIPPTCPEEYANLIRDCLRFISSMRPPFTRIVTQLSTLRLVEWGDT